MQEKFDAKVCTTIMQLNIVTIKSIKKLEVKIITNKNNVFTGRLRFTQFRVKNSKISIYFGDIQNMRNFHFVLSLFNEIFSLSSLQHESFILPFV